MQDIRIDVYNSALEDILQKEGEKCRGYAWLHQKCEAIYSRYHLYLSIPTIVLSTLIGATSVGSTSLFGDKQDIATPIIGVVSILVGILQTLNNTFAFAKRAEGHRLAYLTYSKLHNFICLELALPRQTRMKPENLIKSVRETMERSAEISPSIKDSVIRDFNIRFKDYSVAKPEITNGLSAVRIYTRQDFQQRKAPASVGSFQDIETPQSPVLQQGHRSQETYIPSAFEMTRPVQIPNLPEDDAHHS